MRWQNSRCHGGSEDKLKDFHSSGLGLRPSVGTVFYIAVQVFKLNSSHKCSLLKIFKLCQINWVSSMGKNDLELV